MREVRGNVSKAGADGCAAVGDGFTDGAGDSGGGGVHGGGVVGLEKCNFSHIEIILKLKIEIGYRGCAEHRRGLECADSPPMRTLSRGLIMFDHAFCS
jgi:hypothetical protein